MTRMKSSVEGRESRDAERLRPARAGVVLLVLLCSRGAACADDARLGRLFFTPEERANLDLERLTGVAGAGGATAVRLSGITRNLATGGHTVWLNGTPWYGPQRHTGVAPTEDPGTATVRNAEGASIQVKVGESADRVTSTRLAPLAPGSVVVHRK